MNTFSVNDFNSMQQYFSSGVTRYFDFRRSQLIALKNAIKKYQEALIDSLYKDLHKAPTETYATEIGFLYEEIKFTLKHLKDWMKDTRTSTPLLFFPSSSKIFHDPLGIVLIISPWNYPLQLLFAPLAGAIAGGNCAVLKPSEFTPYTNVVIKQIVEETFPKEYITIVEGEGSKVVPRLVKENRFDHVFFTGSITIGKEIAKLAAEKLVTTTLELGGKSPCIVDKDVDIKVAAHRITWGKFINAGQTCVAPDYLMVHASRKEELIDAMTDCIKKFYGGEPKESPDYARIINDRRFNVLESYLSQGEIITGGIYDRSELYIAPTLMQNVTKGNTLMQEEIFGPILPIIEYKEAEEVMNEIGKHSDPLSLYVFSNNTAIQKLFTKQISFGGGCINNTLIHLGNPALPFGGVGYSGSGMYHGKYSFQIFTRQKPVLKTATWLDPSVKYPPYKNKLKFLKRLMK